MQRRRSLLLTTGAARGFGFLRARARSRQCLDLSTCSATTCSPATWRSSPAAAPASAAASPPRMRGSAPRCASSAASTTCSSRPPPSCRRDRTRGARASPPTSANPDAIGERGRADRRAVRQARHARQRRGRQLPRARGGAVAERLQDRDRHRSRRHVQRVARRVRARCSASSDGLVLNISATLHYHGTPLQIHASAAKAGVDAVTKNLAVEWGRFGIRACGIAPGPIGDTEGMKRLAPGDVAREGEGGDPGRPVRHDRRDRGGGGVPALAAAAAYVTGHVLVVDGGHCVATPSIMASVARVMRPRPSRLDALDSPRAVRRAAGAHYERVIAAVLAREGQRVDRDREREGADGRGRARAARAGGAR